MWPGSEGWAPLAWPFPSWAVSPAGMESQARSQGGGGGGRGGLFSSYFPSKTELCVKGLMGRQ